MVRLTDRPDMTTSVCLPWTLNNKITTTLQVARIVSVLRSFKNDIVIIITQLHFCIVGRTQKEITSQTD